MKGNKIMAVKQLSIFLENRRGPLIDATAALANAQIDIRALSLAETPDYGILRVIISDIDKGIEIIRNAGYAVSVNEVLGISIPDSPGGLSGALKVLCYGGFDVEYMYAFVAEVGEQANVVVRVSDTKKAERILIEAGFTVLDKVH